jgi:hypothetical protein
LVRRGIAWLGAARAGRGVSRGGEIEMSVDIASALRAARRAAGLKQAELAGH